MSKRRGSNPGSKPAPEPAREPVTISMTELWAKIKAQPLHEKLFTWGAMVYLLSGLLPPSSWGTPFLGLANLAVFAGLLLHVGGLLGIGPGGSDAFWRVYRWVGIAVGGVLLLWMLVGLSRIGTWPVGFVIGLLAMAVHVYALYRITEKRGLLPFRITK